MARTLERLSPAAVKSANKPGMYGDGGGLWLHVGPNALDESGKPTKTGKSWIYRYMLDGRAREMGLGPVYDVGLAEAREKARACRRLLLDKVDPLEAKHTERKAREQEAAKAISFIDCANQYLAGNRAA